MVPMFAQLHLIKKEENTHLQVIVKAQSYCMPLGLSYGGRWHVEGLTENIVAVGVYYCHVDANLLGGDLKFRPPNCPEPHYNIDTDARITVNQGSAVVFSNVLPHRFTKIINNGTMEQRRTFLNFFVIDPTKPLLSTKSVPASDLVAKSISYYVSRNLKTKIPHPIVRHILSYVPELWPSMEEAKQFRKNARESMKTNKSGWGWINWGNCGTSEFVSSASTWSSDRRSQASYLNHTDSDSVLTEPGVAGNLN